MFGASLVNDAQNSFRFHGAYHRCTQALDEHWRRGRAASST
jgi:hypothetical protein